MTAWSRLLILVWAVSQLLLSGGCSKSLQAEAPKDLPGAGQIPTDLDLVLRADLRRLRRTLPPGAQRGMERLGSEDAQATMRILAEAFSHSDKLWIGVRPSFDPRHWDYVLIVEGNVDSIIEATIDDSFGPVRPIGGGFTARDALQVDRRTSAARIYSYRGKKLIVASAAEVNALQRVIEEGRHERFVEPPDRGLVSFHSNLVSLSEELESTSPRAAMFLRKATDVSGYIDVGTQGLQLEARLTFLDAQEAELAARALKLVFEVLLLQEGSAQTKVPKWEMQSEATDVVVRCFVPISTVAQLLGLR